MTHWERQSSGGVVEAAPRPATGPASAAPAPLLWEDLFRNASPDQQRELLSLAGRQGVLYAHQLPQAGNGTAADRHRPLLTRILTCQASQLPPLRTTPLTFHDDALDDVQRDAVARAIQTPDVCLVQGLPGTGKSRVVAEIVTQAAVRGERVLLAAPNAAAIDRVLDLVAGRDVLCPVRCLAAGERAEFLPPASRGATLAERARRLNEYTLPGARGEATRLEKHCQAHASEDAVWGRLQELAGEHQQLAAREEAQARGRADIAGEVTVLAD